MDKPLNKPPVRSSHASGRKDDEVVRGRPPAGGRPFRAVVRFIIAVLIGVGLTVGWQSYGDVARQALAVKAPGLAALLPVSTSSQLASAASVDPMQQLAPLASNLDALQRNLEQLAARQDQIVQTISALLVVDQEIKQKISSAPAMQPPASTSQPRPVQPALQSASVPRRSPPTAPPSAASPSR